MRGEYHNSVVSNKPAAELPPRARRILALGIECFDTHGTTSACAENTLRNWPLDTQLRNYLRVRGEYIALAILGLIKSELPPRARRIPSDAFSLSRVVGTTSACAENTTLTIKNPLPGVNYLRVRGEYAYHMAGRLNSRELPPRARRIPRSRVVRNS